MALPVIPRSKPRSCYMAKGGLTLNVVNLFNLEIDDTKEAHENSSEYIILCDNSLSMDETQKGQDFPTIVSATSAISQFVNLLSDNDRVSIWGFADSAVLVQRFISATSYNKSNEIQMNVNKISTFGTTTKLSPALQKAFEQFDLSQNKNSRKSIIVLTDGEIFEDKKIILDILKKYSNSGVSLFFIGFGLSPQADALLLEFANGNKEYAFSLSSDDQIEPYFMFVLQKTSLAAIIDPVLVVKPVSFCTIQYVEFVQRVPFGGKSETLYLQGVERVNEPGVFELKLGNIPIKYLYQFIITMKVVLPMDVKEGVLGFATAELHGKLSPNSPVERVAYPLRNILGKNTGDSDPEVIALQSLAEVERLKVETIEQSKVGNYIAANQSIAEARKTVARAPVSQQSQLLSGIKVVEAHLKDKNPQAAAQAVNRQTQARPAGLNANNVKNFIAKHKK